jgi:hypothetical protein
MFLEEELIDQFNQCAYGLAWNSMHKFYSYRPVSAMGAHNFANELFGAAFPSNL